MPRTKAGAASASGSTARPRRTTGPTVRKTGRQAGGPGRIIRPATMLDFESFFLCLLQEFKKAEGIRTIGGGSGDPLCLVSFNPKRNNRNFINGPVFPGLFLAAAVAAALLPCAVFSCQYQLSLPGVVMRGKT